MAYAAIRHCPVFGGTVSTVDEAAVKGMKGVLQVVRLGNAVAVVTDTYWRAKQAIEKLPVTWAGTEANAKVSSDTIRAFLKTGLDATGVPLARNDGDAKAELAKAAKVIEAEYEAPFQNHAPMEPQNCTASVTAERIDLWVPTQNSEASAAAAAAASGMPLDRIEVHKTMLGGGFGRRGAHQEPVREAVLIARAAGRPVPSEMIS
jgi:isoquinoline 1-oxidoreductase beta subunit